MDSEAHHKGARHCERAAGMRDRRDHSLSLLNAGIKRIIQKTHDALKPRAATLGHRAAQHIAHSGAAKRTSRPSSRISESTMSALCPPGSSVIAVLSVRRTATEAPCPFAPMMRSAAAAMSVIRSMQDTDAAPARAAIIAKRPLPPLLEAGKGTRGEECGLVQGDDARCGAVMPRQKRGADSKHWAHPISKTRGPSPPCARFHPPTAAEIAAS